MSYRVVSVIGGLLFSLGVMLTVFADSMIQIVITYSVIAGVGLGLVAPSSYLAFNSYFSEKSAVAMGVCQAAIGLGFMAAPPFCQYLLEQYAFRGTMLLLGGIALNSVVGALLYQPVQWHMKYSRVRLEPADGMVEVPLGHVNELNGLSMAVIPEEEDDLTNDKADDKMITKTNGLSQVASQDTECDEHIVISRRGSLVMSAMLDYRTLRYNFDEERPNGSVYNSTTGIIDKLNNRPISASLTNFSSNLLMFDNSMPVADAPQTDSHTFQRKKRPIVRLANMNARHSLLEQIPDDESDDATPPPHADTEIGSNLCDRVYHTVSRFLDLSLLSDLRYLNIVFGLSLSFVSDSNFFTIFAFYMISLGYSGSDIALCMSVAAGADVIARLILPWLSKILKITPRTAYLLACLTSAIARSVFASMSGNFKTVAVMSGLIGFLKGGMVVNLSLTIAQYCSTEKFAAAYSLFMVITGIMTLTIGSFVGMLSDVTGSYPFCIHVLSGGLILCAITWFIEYVLTCDFTKEREFFRYVFKRVLCK